MRLEHEESPVVRRCVIAAVVLFVLGGFVAAGSHSGYITSLNDKEVKMTVFQDKKGVDKTFTVAKDVKITLRMSGALRTLSPAEVVQRTGRSLSSVYSRRRDLDVPDGRSKARPE